MVRVINNKDISYSIGDTFALSITDDGSGYLTEGMTAEFIIAENEQAEYLIDNFYELTYIAGIYSFELILSESDKQKLPLKYNYIYKIIIRKNNIISTKKSGYFSVVWGE